MEIFFNKRRIEINNKTLTLQIRNEEDKIKILQESQLQLRKQAHDFENQLDIILRLIRNRNQIEEYIIKLSDSISMHQNKIITGNIYIDTILTNKYYEAINKGINITFDINDFSKFTFLETHDIVSLLSNTIDNAIEASQQCINFKTIDIQLKYDDRQMLYSISNTVLTPVFINIDENIKSSKPNSTHHGYGIKIIKDIVKRYNGYMNYSYSNGKLIFICIINNTN